LLRLAYHDAATYSVKDGKGGANASIQFEFDRPENTGLKRGWNVITQVCCACHSVTARG
jgi:L-ascorbate peroxidase